MNTPVPVRPTNTAAILSLVFGLVCWVVLPFIGAIVAVICGHVARGEIRRAPPGTIEGEGMALAGLILGYVHLALFVLAFLAIVLIFGGLAIFGAGHH